MEQKTLFNTTNKSNFILNMTPEKLHTYVCNISIICVLLPFLGGMLWIFNEKLAYIGAGLLTLSGFSSVLIFVIAVLKKDVLFKKGFGYFPLIALAGLALISSFFAYRPETALYGNAGRFEGLLAILSYMGLFLLGSLVSSKKDIYRIFDVIIGVGLAQGIIAVLQHYVPSFPTYFRHLSAIGIDNMYFSSGTSGSPIFFGIFITIVFGISLVGACYDNNSLRNFFYSFTSFFMIIVSLFTNSIIPVIGISLTFIIVLVYQIYGIIKKKNSAPQYFTYYLIMLLVGAAIFFGVYFLDKGHFYDLPLIWQDSYMNLGISGNYPFGETLSYSHLWKGSVDIILQHPLVGTGADCLFVPQIAGTDILSTTSTFDKSYNDYLYIAATRGIPSLLVYLVLIGYSIKKVFGGIKLFLTDSSNWFVLALITVIISYLAVMFIGASSIFVAPFFWILLGMTNSQHIFNDNKALPLKNKVPKK